MRRMSWMICAAGLGVLAGCESPQPARGPGLPDPTLQTKQKQQPKYVSKPTPTQQKPPPVHKPTIPAIVERAPAPEPDIHLDTGNLMPPRGVSRGKWNVIVVHHSANLNDSPRSMDSYHRERGWENGLGYHFVIGNGVNYGDGKVFAGPRWKSQETGAHCKAGAGRYFGVSRPANFFNEHGVGICLIGNFEGRGPSGRQLDSLEQVITFVCSQTGIAPNRVYGHGEVTGKTACPGRVLRGKLAQVRKEVARNLAWGGADFDGSPDVAYALETGADLDAGAEFGDSDGVLDIFACDEPCCDGLRNEIAIAE